MNESVSAGTVIESGSADRAPVLEMVQITKSYSGVRALRGASVTIGAPGRVHALMGSNGSGKSTLLGILSGQIKPDGGTMTLGGRSVAFSSPSDAVRKGIVMVSQETSVAPDLSVAENILLGGRQVRSKLGIDWKASRGRASEVLAMLQVTFSPEATVRSLRPDQRQMVEIARAVSMEASLVILDEPTSSLTDDEVEALFTVIRRLQSTGVSVIFVSHRLREVKTIADDVTVLRDGCTVATGLASDFSQDRIVAEMIGNAELRIGQGSRQNTSAGAVRLRVSGLSVTGVLEDVGLEAHAGEIVGLAGLEGAGRTELLEVIFGVREHDAGLVAVDDHPLPGSDPRTAMDHGVGYLPPDRKSQGVVLSMSIEDNMAMVKTRDLSRLRPPVRRQRPDDIDGVMSQLSIRAPSRATAVGDLSGGNQQKVALGKWLIAGLRVLLLEEPTRGVDVSAKAEIHAQIGAVAEAGLAVVVSSSEYDELLALSDRILVMFRGRIVASLDKSEATEALISRYAGGG